MPLRGLDRGNNNDKWLNEAIVNFLKIINMDYVSKIEIHELLFALNILSLDQTFVEHWSPISIRRDSTGDVL